MPDVRVEFADRIPGHAGSPQRMPRQIGVALVAEDLAVDFQIRDGPALLAPKRVPEVFLPQRGRLDDLAVGIEHCKVFGHHPLLVRRGAIWIRNPSGKIRRTIPDALRDAMGRAARERHHRRCNRTDGVPHATAE
jgi:hypothetical protein